MSEANGGDVEEEVEEASVIISEDVGVSETAAENAEANEAVEELASETAKAATKEAFVEVPVTAEEPAPAHEDEKTEDQVTEIEEEKQPAGVKLASSLEEVRDIPVEAEETPAEEVSVVEEEADATKSEPPAEEAAPEASPPTTIARKKVTIEESPARSPPPVAAEDAVSPTKRDPSWWKKSRKSEDETTEASEVSVEEQKSEEPSEPPAAAAPAEAPAEESVSVEETKEESVREEAPASAEETFVEIPVVAEEAPATEEESKVELEPVEESKPEPAREAASPPREHVSRRDKGDLEDRARAAAALETAHGAPTPVVRAPSYVTYSSWAPASDYRTSYIPTYSSYIRPSLYYHSEYTTPYTRPTSYYLRTFDSCVRTGPFGQSSYAVDRLRTRSRSRERSRYSYSGYFTPPPLRRNREYSLPSRYSQSSGPPSAAPSRSGSFVNFMDYVVTTDNNLRRSASRTSGIYPEEGLSRSASKVLFPTPADTINHFYDQKIAHMNSYVMRLNDVYDNNVYGYSSRYNTSRPFTGYVTSGIGDWAMYARSMRGHSSDLERRLGTHKTYLRAYDLTRVPTMTRSIFY